MSTPKSVINRIICTAGAVLLLLCLGELSTGSVFINSDRSKVLLILTVLAVFFVCVKSVGHATGCGLRPDRSEATEYIFPVAFLAIAGCAVRCVTFILVDLPVFEADALIVYASTAVNTVVLFLLARRLWGGPSAVAVCLFHCIWGAADIITAYSHAELGIKVNWLSFSQSVAFISLLFMFLAISAVRHNTSIVMCVLSGVFAGIAVAFESGFVLLIVCAITYYIMATPRIREKKIWSKKPQPIKRAAFVCMYLAGAVASFLVLAFAIDLFGRPEAFYTFKSFELFKPQSFIGLFKGIDEVMAECFDLFEFPRNYFANYVHLIVCVVMFICAVVGAFAAGKKKDIRTMVLAEYIALALLFVFTGAGSHMIITVIPYVTLLAVYGMNLLYEFFGMFSWIYRGGSVNPAFLIKYVLPDENIEISEPETEETVKEPEEDSYTDYSTAFGENVAKGADRDELLSSLAEKAHK